MNKQEKIDLIVAYMEGNVRDEEVELFYQLLETDKEFEELVGEYHQIDMLLEEMFPDDDEETFIENEFDVKDEIQKKITLTTQMGKNQKTKKNMFLMRWIAASVLLLFSIGFIYYLNSTTKNNQKITKNKNHTDKSLDKKENTIPKIDKDSLKNEKDNVVEKKEKIEIVLPKKEKIEEKIAVIPNEIKQKFESKNRSLEAMAEDGSSRSTKFFKIIVPQNNENFKDKVLFEWKWEKENTQPTLTLIILDRFGNEYKKFEMDTKQKVSSYTIDVSNFEPALYYFQISTTQESIPYTGRFFVRKPF